MTLENFCTTKEAAKQAGVTEAYVRQLLAKGTLKGEKIGGTWLVLRKSVDGFARIPRMGRPKKKPKK